jgi:putative transcriptional regulator
MRRFWPPPAPTPTPYHWKTEGPEAVGPARRVSLAKRIRWRLRMSQSDFAEAFHIPVGTLRDWEQHRREPDQAARAYLEVITRNPKAVIAALQPPP